LEPYAGKILPSLFMRLFSAFVPCQDKPAAALPQPVAKGNGTLLKLSDD